MKDKKSNMKEGKDQRNGRGALRKKYERGPRVSFKGITDKKLKGQLKAKEKLYGEATLNAAQVEQWLLPSEGGFLEAEGLEQTRNFSQQAIVNEVDISSARKAFDLQLPDLGPYTIDYSLNGRYLALAGRKGHLAIMDWKQARLITELQDHITTLRLEFLPHHFLLSSTDKVGILRYQDTSTGQMVVQLRTHLGRCGVLRRNPYNSVLGLGHNNGTVSMWSPNMGTPLVSMLCHQGPVSAIAFDLEGRQMVTGGIDGKVKVWDVRKFAPLHSYFSPTAAKSLDISQRGLLAVAAGSGVEIWRDALAIKQAKPYMQHRVPKGARVQDMIFCPYEDVLALGHSTGISSLLVPGSGEPNFDTYVANPFESLKQRREAEVHKLLDKLQPEMIVLDPDQIGSVVRTAKDNQQSKEQLAKDANQAVALTAGKPLPEKKKTKGRNKPSKRLKRKLDNIVSVKRALIASQRREDRGFAPVDENPGAVPQALARFRKK